MYWIKIILLIKIFIKNCKFKLEGEISRGEGEGWGGEKEIRQTKEGSKEIKIHKQKQLLKQEPW